jgi:hypothetical protein
MELGQIHPALAKDKISGMLASLVNGRSCLGSNPFVQWKPLVYTDGFFLNAWFS